MDEQARQPRARQLEPSSGAPARACFARERGDAEAFEELFNRMPPRLAHCRRFFRQREQIEEIVQESFMKAYFALPDFANGQETLSPRGSRASL
jgi:hypothetical protein